MSKLELHTIIGIAQQTQTQRKDKTMPIIVKISEKLSTQLLVYHQLTGLANMCLSVITCGQNVCGSNYRKYWHLTFLNQSKFLLKADLEGGWNVFG